MTIKQLFYVICDGCETQAKGGIAPDARGALTLAREADFRRRKRSGRMVDLCRRCREA